MAVSEIELRGIDRVVEKFAALPTEIEAGLFGATVLSTATLVGLVEAVAPRRSGRMASLIQGRVYQHVGETIGVVFTSARYARFPEAGTIYQRAQRFFGRSEEEVDPLYRREIEIAISAALRA